MEETPTAAAAAQKVETKKKAVLMLLTAQCRAVRPRASTAYTSAPSSISLFHQMNEVDE